MTASFSPRPNAGSRPADVAPDSAAARQLALLAAFTNRECSAPDFARGWCIARSASLANGGRVRGRLGDLFDRVFMTLEDYSFDPAFAEPGDLDDTALLNAVCELRGPS